MIFQQIFLQKKSFVCLSQHFVALNFWAYAKVFSKPVLNTTKVIFTQQSFIFISLTQNILSNRKSMNLLISLFFYCNVSSHLLPFSFHFFLSFFSLSFPILHKSKCFQKKTLCKLHLFTHELNQRDEKKIKWRCQKPYAHTHA